MQWLIFIFIFYISGCVAVGSKSIRVEDSGPDADVDVTHVKDAVPKFERITKAGNSSPYRVLGSTYRVNFDTLGFSETGKASWYGKKFHGNKTANGETYDMFAMTAAHKSLPIPSYVRVTNLDNRHSVVVRVNDRGPFHKGRIIDLSYAAAKKLGIQQAGTGNVRVDIVSPKIKSPVSASKPSKNGQFVQIGAFSRRSSADELQRRVSEMTPQRVFVLSPSNTTYHKVIIGPVASEGDLKILRRKLLEEKLSDSHLVKF